jgi:hypothetical protein
MANNVDYSKNSPNYTPNASVRAAYGFPRSIDWITIHWWGDPNANPSFEGVVSWLCQARSQVSAHDVITGTGSRVAVLVDYNNAAWHAGNAQGNATTLGFECDPRCRDEDYEAVAQDVAETWKYYGRVIGLRGHNSWVGTQCPGNYDLNRIYARAMEIYVGKPAPVPVTEVKRTNFNPVKKFKFTRESDLEPIPNGGNAGNRKYPVGEVIELAQLLEMSNGDKWYRTSYSASKEIATGFRANYLEEVVAAPVTPPVPVIPEWVRNTVDITDVKLTVLKAEGAQVYNLATLEPLPSTIIPKGTQVDIAKETTIGGVKYYLSKWSVDHGVSNGVIADQLGTPVEPPVTEKPEWLKNLNDIADKTVYTRAVTPILVLEDGRVEKEVPINTPLLVTHATQILGQNLLVLEGGKTAIETVYASDEPIKNPNDDIDKRLNALEAIVKVIVDFLTSMFKGFKAK